MFKVKNGKTYIQVEWFPQGNNQISYRVDKLLNFSTLNTQVLPSMVILPPATSEMTPLTAERFIARIQIICNLARDLDELIISLDDFKKGVEIADDGELRKKI